MPNNEITAFDVHVLLYYTYVRTNSNPKTFRLEVLKLLSAYVYDFSFVINRNSLLIMTTTHVGKVREIYTDASTVGKGLKTTPSTADRLNIF